MCPDWTWCTARVIVILMHSSELLARIQRRDHRALETLYRRTGPYALAVAKRIVGRMNEAEDVVQEAFVEVWRRADQYDQRRGSGEAWVLGIVRNRAIDRLRHRAVVLRAVQDEGAPPPTPLEDATAIEERRAVVAALAEIPRDQRAAIELAYYDGLSHSEIAAKIGEPLGTVKTRIRTAMEKLTKLLSAHRSPA